MFTKEGVEKLSEFLGIKFSYSDYPTKMSCIFSDDNHSYIDYDYETKQYQFLLVYSDTAVFTFELKSLNHKRIYEAMKNYNNEMYQLEMAKLVSRKRIYHNLKKKI